MAVNSTSGDMCSLKFVTIKRRSDFRLQLSVSEATWRLLTSNLPRSREAQVYFTAVV